jgi:hypothetical protein
MLEYYQTYLLRVGEERYVGHTKLALKQRIAIHRSAAKTRGFNSKLHVALRAADYQCTIVRIEAGMYETLNEARANEDLWIKNYDTITNGLNSARAMLTEEESRSNKMKRDREYQQKHYAKTAARKKIKVACWNCDKVVKLGSISSHRKGFKCSAIKMNSLKYIKMYL